LFNDNVFQNDLTIYFLNHAEILVCLIIHLLGNEKTEKKKEKDRMALRVVFDPQTQQREFHSCKSSVEELTLQLGRPPRKARLI